DGEGDDDELDAVAREPDRPRRPDQPAGEPDGSPPETRDPAHRRRQAGTTIRSSSSATAPSTSARPAPGDPASCRRWARTGTASVFRSSGTTYRRPSTRAAAWAARWNASA